MTVLRKLQLKDAQDMYECMCDSNVNKYMNISAETASIEKCTSFIENSNTDKENIHFAIIDTDDRWCGTISLKHIDKLVRQAEYAIITSPRIHGSGIAKKATDEIIMYAFEQLGLNRIYLNVLKDNVRANKFYLKCGFEYEGCFRQSISIKGKIYDLNWYSVLYKG